VDTESTGLDDDTFGQLGAGDTGGKTEVVLDASSGTGLAADRHGIDSGDGETVRGAVHTRGQPGGARADDQ
jgi:hypothetical protein